MASLFSTLSDIARATLPGLPDRALASFDAAAGRVERLGVQAIRGAPQVAKAIRAISTQPRYGVEQQIVYATKPPDTVLSQIQPVNQFRWDLDLIDDALIQHELGFFLQSSQLSDAMGRDDRIPACRNTRVRALASKSGVGFSLTPSTNGIAKAAIDLAKEITEVWWYSISEAVLQRILEDAVMLGVAFARIHWERIGGRVVPRLEPWWAHTIYYDWSIRRYRAIGVEGQVIIDPGSAEWLVFEPANYRSWMSGAIRALSLSWKYRNFCQDDWARFCEKHGNPIIKIVEPSGHQWSAQKQIFFAQVRQIGREGVIRVPKDKEGYGFDLSYAEPKDRSWAAFQEFLVRLDTNIAITLLGQNLTTENGGSYAAAQVHNLIRLDYLDADAETLATCLREMVWKPYVRFNHRGVDPEAAPWPTWQTRPPEDMAARVTILGTFATAVSAMATANIPVDLPRLAETFQVPMTHDMRPIILPPGGAPPHQWPDDTMPAPATPAASNGPAKSGKAGGAKPGGAAVQGPPGPGSAPDTGKGDADRHVSNDDAGDSDDAQAHVLAVLTAMTAPLPTRVYCGGRLRVRIDRPEGFVQSGVGDDGIPWERTYQCDYGYLDGTLGGDGEPLDVYCGPDTDADTAWWVAQIDSDGEPDEWKLFLGYPDAAHGGQDAVRDCFVAHTPPRFIGGIFAMPVEAVCALLGEEPVARMTLLSMATVDARIVRRTNDVVILAG